MILDSNIIIYSIRPDYVLLARYLQDNEQKVHVSLISHLEVLGYQAILPSDEIKLKAYLNSAKLLPLNRQIITEAIRLRQQRKRSLADSIIAATGLLYDQPVLTNNVADFADIDGLRVIAMADILNA